MLYFFEARAKTEAGWSNWSSDSTSIKTAVAPNPPKNLAFDSSRSKLIYDGVTNKFTGENYFFFTWEKPDDKTVA